mmetsp:Transcript_9233/g.23875  ORF Transcript_9233/g.23875 Transcript_9233/m.23875 type:complete len:99 (+) Transcript_9233:253-549(+)
MKHAPKEEKAALMAQINRTAQALAAKTKEALSRDVDRRQANPSSAQLKQQPSALASPRAVVADVVADTHTDAADVDNIYSGANDNPRTAEPDGETAER